MEKMVIWDIFAMRPRILHDGTTVVIRDRDLHCVAEGKWFSTAVLSCFDFEVKSFTWQNDGKLFIDLAQDYIDLVLAHDYIDFVWN